MPDKPRAQGLYPLDSEVITIDNIIKCVYNKYNQAKKECKYEKKSKCNDGRKDPCGIGQDSGMLFFEPFVCD